MTKGINDILSKAQNDFLIPAFNQIVEVLENRGIKATVTATDDSRTITFLDKNGRDCEYRCHLTPLERPRVYRNFKRAEADHGLHGEDLSGAFVDEITPEIVVRDFQGLFHFHI